MAAWADRKCSGISWHSVHPAVVAKARDVLAQASQRTSKPALLWEEATWYEDGLYVPCAGFKSFNAVYRALRLKLGGLAVQQGLSLGWMAIGHEGRYDPSLWESAQASEQDSDFPVQKVEKAEAPEPASLIKASGADHAFVIMARAASSSSGAVVSGAAASSSSGAQSSSSSCLAAKLLSGGAVASLGDDKYILGALLGSGAFANVYECSLRHVPGEQSAALGGSETERSMYLGSSAHPLGSSNVAVKVLERNPNMRDAALMEVCILDHCKGHPGIVQLYDIFMQPDSINLVFERFDRSFRDVMPSMAAWPACVRVVTFQLVDALRFLHSLCIIHADVKPENVLTNAPADVAPLQAWIGPAALHVKLADMGSSMYPSQPVSQ